MAAKTHCCNKDDPMDCEERAACDQAGKSGHTSCGTCPEHQRPRHRCGCLATPATRRRATA